MILNLDSPLKNDYLMLIKLQDSWQSCQPSEHCSTRNILKSFFFSVTHENLKNNLSNLGNIRPVDDRIVREFN